MSTIENMKAQLTQARDTYKIGTDAIKANRDLSEEGKTKAIAALKAEYRKTIDGLVIGLRRAALEEATEAQSAQGLKELLQRDYAKWDYSRLAYEATRVKSAFVLAGGNNFDAIADAWQKVKDRGDKYEIKAWLDQAPAILPPAGAMDSHGTETRAAILEDIAAAEIYTLTEEGRKYETQRAERVNNLQEVAAIAAEIGGELAALEGMPRARVVQRVFSGIAQDRASGQIILDRQPGETAAQIFERTEANYQEHVNGLEALTGESFDALVYGLE